MVALAEAEPRHSSPLSLATMPSSVSVTWPRPGYGNKAFTGREWDSETNLYYYRARYYDPKVGRFLSEDPIGFVAGMNFYAYVENNPVNYTDPFGLKGTNSCSYYKLRCFQSGGKYYCEKAQYWCNKFPKDPDPDSTWSGCTRQCLQDCDQEQYRSSCSSGHPNPDPSTDEFSDLKPTACHIKCYVTSTKCIPQ